MSKIAKIGLLFEGGLAVLALALGAVLEIDPLSHAQLELMPIFWGVVATAPMLLLLYALERWAPLEKLRRLVDVELRPLFQDTSALGLLLLSASAGVGEELLFRGLLQDGLTGWVGPVFGLVLASLIFGLAHFISVSYFVLTGLIGIYLGGLYLLTGNLWTPIVAHGLYDFLALMYITRR